MYKPRFRYKYRSNVPLLSNEEIERDAEAYIRDFAPERLEAPGAVDIDEFAEVYLEHPVMLQHLSRDGKTLGNTVFNQSPGVMVFDMASGKESWVSADPGTILIEQTLLEKNPQMYRFTLAHECGHIVYHGAYFTYPDVTLNGPGGSGRDQLKAGRRISSAAGSLSPTTTVWSIRQTTSREQSSCRGPR